MMGKAEWTAVGLCATAGALCAWARTPIPWMIGPLLVMALAKWRGVAVNAPPGFRGGGQLVIGTALGLYFTAEMLRIVGRYLPWMALAGVFALLIGWLSGQVLARLAQPMVLDRATAFFACVPGGASEMSNLAGRNHGRQDLVAVSQSMRILIIVLTIPFIYTYSGIHGADVYTPGPKVVEYAGLAKLLGVALVTAWVAQRIGVPNGFVLGPLFATIVLTGSGVTWSAMPGWLSNFGQLMIGCALGSRFEQDFFRSAPRFLMAATVATLVALLMATAFAVGMGWLTGIHWTTAILALAPGGMPEMSITAKVLQLGVPLVVAFHVTRMAILVTVSGWVFRRFIRGVA